MTNHSYKGLTQPLQTDTAKPCPAKHRPPPLSLLLLLYAAVRYPAAARTKTSIISVQLLPSCCYNKEK